MGIWEWLLMLVLALGGLFVLSPKLNPSQGDKDAAAPKDATPQPSRPLVERKAKKSRKGKGGGHEQGPEPRPTAPVDPEREAVSDDDGTEPQAMDEDEVLMSMVSSHGRGAEATIMPPAKGHQAVHPRDPPECEASGSDSESWIIAKPRGVSKQFGSASSLDSGLEGGGTVPSMLGGDTDEGWEAVPRSTPKPRPVGSSSSRPPVPPTKTATPTQKRNEKRREKKELLRALQQQIPGR